MSDGKKMRMVAQVEADIEQKSDGTWTLTMSVSRLPTLEIASEIAESSRLPVQEAIIQHCTKGGTIPHRIVTIERRDGE